MSDARHPVFLYVAGNKLMIEHGWSGDVLAGLPLPPPEPGHDTIQIGKLSLYAKGRFSADMVVKAPGHAHLDMGSVRRIPDWRPGRAFSLT